MKVKPYMIILVIFLIIGFFLSILIYSLEQEKILLLTKPTHSLIIDAADYGDENASIASQLRNHIREQPFNLVSFVIFVMAIIHTFLATTITSIARSMEFQSYKTGKRSGFETFCIEFLYFMGEVEVVFGIWVIPLIACMTYFYDWKTAVNYLNNLDYTEALFVVIIMAVASSSPIVSFAEKSLHGLAKIGGGTIKAWWWTLLAVGSLLGSLITEPAAMTICALLLGKQFYYYNPSSKLAYATLGLLFTAISVGGMLTNFAAPPILIVAKKWDWGTYDMFRFFGIKAAVGIFLATLTYYLWFRKELNEMEEEKQKLLHEYEPPRDTSIRIPFWITLINLLFLVWFVFNNHYPAVFIGSFLLFLGFQKATAEFQSEIELKTPILVGFFLAGLIAHGELQEWWISPVLGNADPYTLALFAMSLTAFNDNASIAYLATLIPNISETMKFAVIAGAMSGGGLTVIANAPNPAGQAILGKHFPSGISALRLFLSALVPMAVMLITFATLWVIFHTSLFF